MAPIHSSPDVTGRPAPPEALHDQIRARIAAAKPSASRTRGRLLWALIAIPLIAGVVLWIASDLVYHRQAVGLDVDGAQSTVQLLVMLLSLAGMTGVATLFAAWRGSRGFGAGAVSLALVASLVTPLYAAVTLVRPLHLHDAAITGVVISPWGVRCAVIAGVVGLTVMASFVTALRRAVPVATRLRGAVLGAAAGAWAGLSVFVFCPSGDQQHLIAGHVLPVLVLTLIGALATPRLLRP